MREVPRGADRGDRTEGDRDAGPALDAALLPGRLDQQGPRAAATEGRDDRRADVSSGSRAPSADAAEGDRGGFPEAAGVPREDAARRYAAGSADARPGAPARDAA